jgi:quinolinate synthase
MEEEIRALKTEKNAVIMAHNYQPPEIQALADVVGDSLELAVKAKEARADLIVVCGVRFMAETAKILNPDRKVVIPVEDAGCPLADFLTPDLIREAKGRYPDAAVVVYVNSTAESKALADITCTSANAVNVVASLPEETILFGPDANLAAYVQRQLPKKTIIPMPPGGHCYVHAGFTLADVEAARAMGSRIVCHPECPPQIQQQADVIASTGGMVRGAAAGGDEPWSVFTERDMVSRLRVLYPGRVFYEKPEAICADMKKISLADLRQALESGEHEVVLPRDVMDRARRAIERMLAVGA